MNSAALPVMSVNPAPGVSTRNVALASSCGATSMMADKWPGMDAGCLAFTHDVFLNGDDHVDQASPCFFEVLARTRHVLLGRQIG